MTIANEQEVKKSALQLIAEQTQIAHQALAKAEALAKLNGVSFTFSIGNGTGYYEAYKNHDGTIEGYWDGWEGSSC